MTTEDPGPGEHAAETTPDGRWRAVLRPCNTSAADRDWSLIGCTDPVTTIQPAFFDCP